MREKKRYLLFEACCNNSLEFNAVRMEIEREFVRLAGESGYGAARIRLLKEFWDGRTGVATVSNKYVDHLKVSLMLIRKINNQDVIFRSIKVSGTLKKIKNMLNMNN